MNKQELQELCDIQRQLIATLQDKKGGNGANSLNIKSLDYYRGRFYTNTMYGKFILSEYAQKVFDDFLLDRGIK